MQLSIAIIVFTIDLIVHKKRVGIGTVYTTY